MGRAARRADYVRPGEEMQVRPETAATTGGSSCGTNPLRISRESFGLSLGRLRFSISSEKIEVDPRELDRQCQGEADSRRARSFAAVLAAARTRAGSFSLPETADAPVGRLGVMRRGLAVYAQAALENVGGAPATTGFAAVV